jgi:hypothetical protein
MVFYLIKNQHEYLDNKHMFGVVWTGDWMKATKFYSKDDAKLWCAGTTYKIVKVLVQMEIEKEW